MTNDWTAFYNNLYQKHDYSSDDWQAVEEVYEILKNNTVFDSNDCLIDIGCGAGEYSLVFSKYLKEVTALDNNEFAIESLNKEITARKIKNIKTIKNDFTTLNEERFDIVFCSYFPGLQTFTDLKYLCKLAKKYLVIMTVDKNTIDYHRFNLLKLLPVKERTGFILNAEKVENILISNNLNYKKNNITKNSSTPISYDSAVKKYLAYFKSLNYDNEEAEKIIINYIKDNLVQGMLIEKNTICTACIIVPLNK